MKITMNELRSLIREAIDDEREYSEKDELISVYSDVYKEKYGFRPRGKMEALYAMSVEALRAELDELYDEEGYYDDAHKIPPDEEGSLGPDPEMYTDDPWLHDEDPFENEPSATPIRQPSRDRHRRHH